MLRGQSNIFGAIEEIPCRGFTLRNADEEQHSTPAPNARCRTVSSLREGRDLFPDFFPDGQRQIFGLLDEQFKVYLLRQVFPRKFREL